MLQVTSKNKNHFLSVYSIQGIFQIISDKCSNFYLRQELFSYFPILHIKGLGLTGANDFPKVVKSPFSKPYLCDCRRCVLHRTLANSYVVSIQWSALLTRMIYLWLWLEISSHPINKISLYSHMGHTVKATFEVNKFSSLNFPLNS